MNTIGLTHECPQLRTLHGVTEAGKAAVTLLVILMFGSISSALFAADSVADWLQPVRAPKDAPNVILILLDDVGFSASNTFGGPVQMPTLETLAANGLRYNRFHGAVLAHTCSAAGRAKRSPHGIWHHQQCYPWVSRL